MSRLIVNPAAYITRKVPISAIGSVRPVITVLRQELRNRNTMRMVSAAPSSSVRLTLFTESRMPLEVSRTISSFTSGGSTRASEAITSRTPSTTSMVLASWALTTSSATARLPSTMAMLSSSSWPSTTVATWERSTGWPPRRATMIERNCSGRTMRPCTCTICSRSRVIRVPAGNSWFSFLIAWIN